MTAPLLHALSQAVGVEHVWTRATHDLSSYEQDWRRRERGQALAVVRPGSTQEVAAVVQACVQAGASIVPQGGNTGLVVGSTPDASGTQVVLSLQRMNRVLAVDAANLSLTAQAGCVLAQVQASAHEAGLLFPLSLAAEGSCTIGGNLATNAGGTQVLRYGNARDLCLGLEVVTARGEVWESLTGLRKDNTGYDLRHLFVGSEGTLGIITAATLKLYPQPAARVTAWASVPDVHAAVDLLGRAQRHLAAGLTGFELMNPLALQLVAKHYPQSRIPLDGAVQPYRVLLELSSSQTQATALTELETLLGEAIEAGTVGDCVVAQSGAQSHAMWHIRESIPLAQADEGLNIKHDISVATSRIADFCAHTEALLARHLPGVRLVNFGHLGDGNLHYNVQVPAGGNGAAFLRQHEKTVNTLVYDSVAAHGGSISAEHGVGSLKAMSLPHYKSPVALQLMRAIKQALDPAGTLNPGRVLGHPADWV
jgi:FAD/FMN-containing dehydrogenase